MMKCAGCMKYVKEANAINCSISACEKSFCTTCINITAFSADRKKNWICPDCSSSLKKGGDNSLTPIRGGPDFVTSRKKTESTGSDVSVTLKKTDSTGSEVNLLTEQLRVMTIQFSAIVTKLDDVSQSLTYNNERLDEMMVKWKATDERIKNLEKRDKEVETLQASVMHLQNELKSQAQYNLRNEIEISGIPENISENLFHTVLVAAKKVGVELEDRDIDWISRVGPRRPPVTTTLPEDGAMLPRPVVVRLLRRIKRDQFLNATKSRKNIKSTDLDVVGAPRKVFFNERLTKDNRILFRDSRIRAKELGYAFCWCSHGSLYVRQREGKSALLIRSHKDLDLLLQPLPGNV